MHSVLVKRLCQGESTYLQLGHFKTEQLARWDGAEQKESPSAVVPFRGSDEYTGEDGIHVAELPFEVERMFERWPV